MKQVYVSLYNSRYIYTVKEVNSAGDILNSTRYDCITTVYNDASSGRQYILMLDKDGHIRQTPFDYINIWRNGQPFNSRRQAAVAIQLYETFCDIYGFDRTNLSKLGYEKLKRFLFREEMIAEDGYLSVRNSVKTVNAQCGSIKKYLRTMDYSTKAFECHDNNRSEHRLAGGHVQHAKSPKGDPDLRSDPQAKLRLPEHLNPNQMREIIKETKSQNDIQMEAVTRLGYGYGFRRGEILGLTTEDLVMTYDKKLNEYKYYIILRNRASDENYQHAKTLKKPPDQSYYITPEYKKSYHRIQINKATYDIIINYYNSSRKVKSEKEARQIEFITLADSVTGTQPNHYIFINRTKNKTQTNEKGEKEQMKWNRLTGITLNNKLRKYFNAKNIELRNCCHALRHSFAMFYAHYCSKPVRMEILQQLLRHASIESTQCYYHLTHEELHELTKEVSLEIEYIFHKDNE